MKPVNRLTMLCLAAMLLVLPLHPLLAQNILCRHYQMKKQMPCGVITAIEPAGRYVWFGGWALRPGEDNGLARYDKRTRKWRLFLESEAVIADEINSLTADGEQLWIGSTSDWPWNRGLHLYDPGKKENIRFTVKDGLPYWRVRDVVIVGDVVWAATMGGVARYDKNTRKWKAFSEKTGDVSTNFTISIHADERNVWVGSFNGLEVYDIKARRWRSLNKENSIFSSAVLDIEADENTIWFLAPPQVITFDKQLKRFEQWPVDHAPARNSELRNMSVTRDKIFLGSDSGLHVWDKRTRQWQTYNTTNGLPHETVYTLGADEEYAWCVDKLGRTVSQLDLRRRRWQYFTYRKGSPSNHVRSLVSDGSHLYVGTLGSGLWRYDIRRDQWANLNLRLKSGPRTWHYRGEKTPVKYSDIRQMALRDGRVWMATNHGLCVHDPKAEEQIEVLSAGSYPMLCFAWLAGKWYCGGQRGGLRTFDPKTKAWEDLGKKIGLEKRVPAMQAGTDALWLTDGARVYRLEPNAGELEQVARSPEGRATALLLDGGKLWIGTDRGLWIYDIKGKSIEEVNKARLPSPIVLTLSRIGSRIWIGTEGGLAYCKNAEEGWQVLTKDDKLVHNIVSAIAADSKYLWVGTMGGGFTRLTGLRALLQEPDAGGQ